MDTFDLLSQAGLGKFVPFAAMACVLASLVVAIVPAPMSGPLAGLWKILNLMALNVGRATNAAELLRRPSGSSVGPPTKTSNTS